MKRLHSPLSEARGLGAAHDGVGHWWMQRLTAVALVPLSLWFVASIASLASASSAQVMNWIGSPAVAIALIIFVICIFHHSQLGLQVVIEDYVKERLTKMAMIITMKFLHIIAAIAAIFSILSIAFGGS
jgi:succinate dehydrogenase / fumarate reductase membrane anchor subunit